MNRGTRGIAEAGKMLICAVCTALCCAQSVHAKNPSEQPRVDSDSRGRLAILPEIQGDAKVCASSVYVLSGGKAVAKATTTFKAPILFEELPVGDVKIRVVPPFGWSDGVAGECEALVERGKLTKVRMPLVRVKASRLEMQIVDVDGKPLSKQMVYIAESAEGIDADGRLVKTDSMGRVAMLVFAGRKYRYVVRKKTDYEVLVFRSEFYEVSPKKVPQGLVWRIPKPSFLTIRFVQNTANGTKGIDRVSIVPESPGAKGSGVRVSDGKVILSKEGKLLGGADKASVYLCSNMLGLKIKNSAISIDDSPDQRVDIELVATHGGAITLKTSVTSAQAYLVRKNLIQVVLNPGQAKPVMCGSYTVMCWAPGYTVDVKEVEVAGDNVISVAYAPDKATPVSVTITDQHGTPIQGAQVRCRYKGLPFIPTQRIAVDKRGAVTISLDDSRRRLLAVVTARGGKLIRMAEKESLGKDVVKFQEPTGVPSRPIRQRVFLFDASCDELLLAEAEVDENGKFSLLAQPGTYDVMLVASCDGLIVGHCEVADTATKLEMGDIKVTAELWKKAEGISNSVK